MTEYEDPLIENFMLCGIKPSILWRNLLTRGLNDHQPTVLFSYPEKEEEQKALLSCIFTKPFQLAHHKPEEGPIQNEQKSSPRYYKVLYEEITEDYLSRKYNIQKVKPIPKPASQFSLLYGNPEQHPLPANSVGASEEDEDKYLQNHIFQKKSKRRYLYKLRPAQKLQDGGALRTNSVYSRESNDSEGDLAGIMKGIRKSSMNKESGAALSAIGAVPESGIPSPSSAFSSSPGGRQNVEITGVSPLRLMPAKTEGYEEEKKLAKLPLRKKRSGLFCEDDMSMAGTSYYKTTKKAKRKFTEDSNEFLAVSQPHIFVPVIFCMKTKNQYSDPSEQLLEGLIKLLYSQDDNFFSDIQNTIYAFANFTAHLIELTHIISPPPLSELTIGIESQEVMYSEGKISGFPGENDCTVYNLCCLVEADYILTLWTAMLLDIRVVIYCNNPNEFFYITKGLNQLLYPFTWVYAKGMIPNLDLLLAITPYCFGILKQAFPNKQQIIDKLAEDSVNFVMLDIDSPKIQNLLIFPKDQIIACPGFYKLKMELDALCKRYNIERCLPTSGFHQTKLDFSLSIRQFFLAETLQLLKGFDAVVRKEKQGLFEPFRERFIKNYIEKEGKTAKADELRFITALSKSQCFAFLFDEVWNEEQGNYARLVASRKKEGSENPFECLRISLLLSPAIILSRMKKLQEIAQKKNSLKSAAVQKPEVGDQLKKKFDWEKELKKMQIAESSLERRSSELRFSKLKSLTAKKYDRNSPFPFARSISSEGSTGKMTMNSEKPKTALRGLQKEQHEEIVLNWEESKETAAGLQKSPALSPKGLLSMNNTEEDKNGSPSSVKDEVAKNIESAAQKPPAPDKMRGKFYGPQGFIAFLHEFLGFGASTSLKPFLIDEIKAHFDRYKNSVSKTQTSGSNEKHVLSSNNDSDEFGGKSNDSDSQPRSEGGSLGEIDGSDRKWRSPLLDSLIDIRDFASGSKILTTKLESPFLFFNSTNCFQYNLCIAFYYDQYDCGQEEVVGAYLDAYKFLQGSLAYSQYFPVMMFKSSIKELDLEFLRDLLYRAGELTSVIKDAYEMKLKSTDRKTLVNASSVILPPSTPGTSFAQSVPQHSMITAKTANASRSSITGSNATPGSQKLAFFKTDSAVSQSESAILKHPGSDMPYINSYKMILKTFSQNPAVIVACALNDLMKILSTFKSKGAQIFKTAGKCEAFEQIEKQAATFRAPNLFAIDKEQPETNPKNNYLEDKNSYYSFFINLYNFTLLFSLCKLSKAVPKNLDEYLDHSLKTAIRIGEVVLTLADIEHAILRAKMSIPKYLVGKKIPRFEAGDVRAKLANNEKQPLISFCLYLPTKSACNLRILKPDLALIQMNSIAKEFLEKRIKYNVSKRRVEAPMMMSWCEEDFDLGKGKENIAWFIGEHLPETISGKYKGILSGDTKKPIVYQFEKYSWDFAFDTSDFGK